MCTYAQKSLVQQYSQSLLRFNIIIIEHSRVPLYGTVSIWLEMHYHSTLKKWSHFDLKSWVTGETKIWPGIPSDWRIFESNWLDIESKFANWGFLKSITEDQVYPNKWKLCFILSIIKYNSWCVRLGLKCSYLSTQDMLLSVGC